MPGSKATDWRELARQHQIDPEEVRMAFGRFDAQRQFRARTGHEPIGLSQWFRFYRLEKATEGRQAGPVPGGCSIDSAAAIDACIERPVEFLQVLQACMEAEAD